ncbi:MAG TPA: hypothetical protein VN776_14380, partial [Terracidiphilus sp.]|nr:hypothetical protein [Terracidiphilus sp.]
MKNRFLRYLFIAILFVASVWLLGEQLSPTSTQAPAGQLTSEQDHQRTMDSLHITSLRKGADPNHLDAPNAVNYDDSKAGPSTALPDPLVMKDGTKVATPAMWWRERRPEVMEEFNREVYGRVPPHTPKVKWQVTSLSRELNGDVSVITKKLVGHVDNSSYPAITVNIDLTLTTPANAHGPVPVIMQF